MIARCDSIELAVGEVLCEPDHPYRDVYFPLTCFISMVAMVRDHPPMEIRLVGNEGMLGATLALAVGDAPQRAVVQGAGSALRMTAVQFSNCLADCPSLRRAIHGYLYVLMAQVTQATACARFHAIEARLARSLLTTHDRAHADRFQSTHKLLADMLGVQRSAITIAAGALRRRKLIGYSRGEISILSRRGLETASCECYRAGIDDYAQRFG